MPEEKESQYHAVVMVKSGNQSIPVAPQQICFFFLDDDYRYLQTFDGKRHLVSQTLDEVEARLNKEMFFRANRQVIVNRAACTRYNALEFGKVEVKTNPAFKEPIIVSQKRSKEFKQWISKASISLSRQFTG